MPLLLGACLRHDPGFALPPVRPLAVDGQRVVLLTRRGLLPEAAPRVAMAEAVLVLVPGVEDLPVGHRTVLLEQIRQRADCELALYFDWGRGLGRRIVFDAATDGAAGALANWLAGPGRPPRVHVLAHSAGTVVVNKAARLLAARDAPPTVAFDRVLFVGTPLRADEPLAALRARSASVLNLYSQLDKVSRNLSAADGHLHALGDAGNVRLSRSLGGRLTRHDGFLANDPEMWLRYGWYFRHGTLPPARVEQPLCDRPRAWWCLAAAVVAGVPGARVHAALAAERILRRDAASAEALYYAVLLAGLAQQDDLSAAMIDLLATPRPAYLRHEIYRAITNMRDGRHIGFLRWARKRDPAARVVTRDCLRELKRLRVVPADR
ncbi:MAG: hypothetical protein ACOCYP_08975 [Planctomycetota bacterium]